MFSIDEMHFMLCRSNFNNYVKIQARKRLILYNFVNGITTLKKICLCKPLCDCKIFEEGINNLSKNLLRKNLQKK
jgi:hypothetical protein